MVIPEKSRYDGKKIRNEAMSSELYSNLLLVAKKKSGKTNLIYNYVKKSVGRETKVYVFASTWHRDTTYKELRKLLEKKGVHVEGYTSLVEGRRNILKEILEDASAEPEEEGEEEEEKETPQDWREKCLNSMFAKPEEKKEEKKKRESKYVSPEMIIILDDLHTEMRSPVIAGLVTRNRHYRSKVIMSTQYVHMVPPQVWANVDICMLGGKLPDEKLQMLHDRLDLTLPEEEFVELYDKATSKKYSFLYIDTNNEQYRRNFDTILR